MASRVGSKPIDGFVKLDPGAPFSVLEIKGGLLPEAAV
jgi:hypothetical protein